MPVPPPIDVPAPGDPSDLSPLEHIWPKGDDMHRCYNIHYGAREYFGGDSGKRGRFHPIYPTSGSTSLPVLYGADDEFGALSETVFHDVPVRGVKQVQYAKLMHRALIRLTPTRDLRLIDLTSDGLTRLGVSRLELIESDPRSYPDTAAWAEALHRHGGTPEFDGLYWVSRQRDTSRAVVLFSDRVETESLVVPDDAYVMPLAVGAGLELVCDLADRADITIVGLP